MSDKSKRETPEDWGSYMHLKKSKLKEQFEESTSLARRELDTLARRELDTLDNLFQGVSIYVNGYTKPSSDELKELIGIHGGEYHQYYSKSRTSHIIATNLCFSKVKNLRESDKVVRPEWITDSIEARKVLPVKDYLVYRPDQIPQQQPVKLSTSKSIVSNPTSIVSNPTSNVSNPTSIVSNPTVPATIPTSCEDSSNDSQVQLFDNNSNQSTSSRESPTKVDALKTSVSLKAGDPGFLEEFFSKSRLHHLSSTGNELKSYIQELREKGRKPFHGLESLKDYVIQNGLQCSRGTGSKEKRTDIDTDSKEKRTDIDTGSKEKRTDIDTDSKEKKIMHIDMDCFFVSVGLLSRPHLVNKPVVVTHARTARGVTGALGVNVEYERNHYSNRFKAIAEETVPVGSSTTNGSASINKSTNGSASIKSTNGSTSIKSTNGSTSIKSTNGSTSTNSANVYNSRSEIACASYEARSFGIKNGSYLGAAKELCPELTEMPYDFEEYERVSRILYDTVASFTLDIEAVSCDEMFVDVTRVLEEGDCSAETLASFLRSVIREKSGCTASVGIGSNVLIAKLASKAAKPNGQMVVEGEEESGFMRRQVLRDLPGIGRTTGYRLAESFSAETCGDLLHVPEERLKTHFGIKTGERLYSIIRGRDRSNLFFHQASTRKSVSAEVNYGIRLSTLHQLDLFMKELATELSVRLERVNSKGRQLTVKMKVRKEDAPVQTAKFMGHGVCNSVSRSTITYSPIHSPESIHKVSMAVIRSLNLHIPDLRGIGIQMTKLEPVRAEESRSRMMIQDYFKDEGASDEPPVKKSSLSTHTLVPSISTHTLVPSISTHTLVPNTLVPNTLVPSTSTRTLVPSIFDKVKPRDPTTPGVSKSALTPCATRPEPVARLSSDFAILPSSMDEIDQEMLDSLPRNIREEILTAFQASKSKPPASSNQPSASSNQPSSSRQSSHVSPKKKITSKKSTKKGRSCGKQKLVVERVVHKGPLDTMFRKLNDSSKQRSVIAIMSTPGALCGQKDVEKMKEIITEWVVTEPEPLDHDIGCIIKLFQDFIQLGQYTNLEKLIETLYEQILLRNSVSWKCTFNTITQIVSLELGGDVSAEIADFRTKLPTFDLVEL